jgi:hypothetical protein
VAQAQRNLEKFVAQQAAKQARKGPKTVPKALLAYRAAKKAKAKKPRRKAAPKAPKCVNGVVHIKAHTRKCGSRKKAAQAGKGIGSKLKTAAKVAGAAALAALAYKNRHIPVNALLTGAVGRATGDPWGETLKNVGKNAWKGLDIPGIKQNTLPKFGGRGRRRATRRKGRGIGSKIKQGLKRTAKIALPVLGALAAANYLGPKAIQKWGPADAYHKALDRGLSPYGLDMLGNVSASRYSALYDPKHTIAKI